jgi:hypothetical protein
VKRVARPLFVLAVALWPAAVAGAGARATATVSRATATATPATPASPASPASPATPASPPNATEVTVGRTPEGNPIPSGFVGVSLEYKTLLSAERPGADGVDPVLAQLVRNLAPGQTPVVRVGGDSTDWTWWPVPGLRRPPGVTDSLSPAWIARARELAVSTGARLILGINLEADSTALAAAEASHLVDGIGRRQVAALELGNEPELYNALPWYHTPAGLPVFGRPASYSPADYAAEFGRFAKALPALPLAGPSTGSNTWISSLGQLIAANPALRMATFHAYALNPFGDAFRGHNCSTPRSDPAHPTVAALLAAYASQGLLQDVAPAVALAHHHGLSFRLDEMNAVTCAGTPGVSNTSASALWVLDALFVLAQAGVDGVNIHTWRGSAGKLFDLHHRHHRWVGSVRPEYYGLLMFARAGPPGSRLLPVLQANPGQVRSWAVMAPRHRLHVVLINDNLRDARWVVVRAPGASAIARLQRLEAPSAYARRDVRLAGQSFGRRTTTGLLAGPLQITVLRRSWDGFVVRLPPASAALLTFSS